MGNNGHMILKENICQVDNQTDEYVGNNGLDVGHG